MNRNHLLSFLLLFASIFCVSTAQSATLAPATINCINGGRIPPLYRTGQVGDTFTITANGNCGFYLNVGGNTVSSTPGFGSLNNTTATIRLTAVGSAYIEVWDSNFFNNGQNISVTSTAASTFNVYGSVVGVDPIDQLARTIYANIEIASSNLVGDPDTFIYSESSNIANDNFAFVGIPPNNSINVWMVSAAYWCPISGGYNPGISHNITLQPAQCYSEVPIIELVQRVAALQVKLFGPYGNAHIAAQSHTITPRTALEPSVTYTANCTSSNGGVSGSGTSTTSTIDVDNLTPGKTYSCSVTAQSNRGQNSPTTTPVNTSNSVTLPLTPPQPSPEPIPTLSEWAQFIMMLMMIGTVGWYTRRMFR